MTQLSGGFTMMSWEETPYDKAEGGNHPKFTHIRATHELHGSIEGEASVCYLMAYRPDGTATFVGLVLVTGAVGSEAGSFLMQDAGTFQDGIVKGRWQILPGYGTEDLQG
ncbi:MAG TPA: DUF3224 domain-containing protein, partial [Gemmatimonadaceae bacterium]